MKSILIIGTGDTKSPELAFLRDCVQSEGARPAIMDVGIMSDPELAVDVARHEVARAAGVTIPELRALGSENDAMAKMAEGASKLVADLYAARRIHGVLVLGGSMGTDLALDVTSALPLGAPKVVVSTVAFSHMIPPERLAPDLIMMLWAGGLYGLNSICKAALSQAAGAVCGAARQARAPDATRPVIGITSFGKSCLKYMVSLAPELEARGYEAAVFHASGMGGRAFEALAAQGRFAAVMDFAVQEVTNHHFGSVISAGPDRLTNAGRAGTPQLVAPGALDLIDLPGWREFPAVLQGRVCHPHNRLLWSTVTTPNERRAVAGIVASRLAAAAGPVKLLLPLGGVHEWDRADGPLHDRAGLEAMFAAFRAEARPPIELIEIDAHINDVGFAERALAELDAWVEAGIVAKPGQAGEDDVAPRLEADGARWLAGLLKGR